LLESLEWVLVDALLRSDVNTEHVGDGGSVTDLLVRHVLGQSSVILGQSRRLPIFGGEVGEQVVEQVELNHLLQQTEVERLAVEARSRRVVRLRLEESSGRLTLPCESYVGRVARRVADEKATVRVRLRRVRQLTPIARGDADRYRLDGRIQVRRTDSRSVVARGGGYVGTGTLTAEEERRRGRASSERSSKRERREEHAKI